ncbi:MAG: tetratricopeptide repeat protein [Leptospirales bacterium]
MVFAFILFAVITILIGGIYIYIKKNTGNKMQPFYDALNLYSLNQYDQAEAAFRNCIYDHPYNSVFHWYLALSLTKKGKDVEAIEPLNEIIKIDNYIIPEKNLPDIERFNKLDVLHELLERFERLKLINEQMEVCYKLMEAEPQNVNHLLYIIQLKFDAGLFDNEARDLLLEVLNTYPERYDVKYLLAVLYYKNEKYDDALQESRPLAAADPDNLKANFIIGESLYKLGVKEEAMGYFSRAARAKEFIKTTLYRLAVYNYEKGTMDSAFTYSRQSLEAVLSKYEDPIVDLNSKYFMAELYEANGDYPEAVELYKTVFQIDPEFREIQDKIRFFKPAMDSNQNAGFDKLSHVDFQKTIDSIMDKMNLKVVRVEMGSDNAVNIIAENKLADLDRVAVFIRRNVSLFDVDQVDILIKFMDGIRAHAGVFISSGNFTGEAVSLMKSVGIKPVPGSDLNTYITAKA